MRYAFCWKWLNSHGEGSPALGGASEGGGIAEHLFQRSLGVDVLHRRPGFDFLDNAAAHGHAGNDVADELLGAHDIDAHHRFEHHRTGLGTGLVEGHARRRLEGEFAGGFRDRIPRKPV
jgi:hypothetical protein